MLSLNFSVKRTQANPGVLKTPFYPFSQHWSNSQIPWLPLSCFVTLWRHLAVLRKYFLLLGKVLLGTLVPLKAPQNLLRPELQLHTSSSLRHKCFSNQPLVALIITETPHLSWSRSLEVLPEVKPSKSKAPYVHR